MKNLILVSAIAMSGLFYQTANAQIGLHVNINLGSKPAYAQPAPVYNDADYYYLPEVEAYYSVSGNCYYYQDGANWVSAAYLPGRFHDYDWQHARRFAVNEPRPYLHNDIYRARYGGIEGRRDWGVRNERNTRAYAERAHFDNVHNSEHFDARRNDNHQQPNNNRGNTNNQGGHDREHGRF